MNYIYYLNNDICEKPVAEPGLAFFADFSFGVIIVRFEGAEPFFADFFLVAFLVAFSLVETIGANFSLSALRLDFLPAIVAPL